jgi:endonuclease-3
MTRQEKADIILEKLKGRYPKVEVPLRHNSAHELLIAVILSAQCTDERVNKVTKRLFDRYKSIDEFADADVDELKTYIKSCGLYNSKAKNIKKTAEIIRDEYEGEVPDTIKDLKKLPGVAKKTASVVMWQWFGKNEGFTVDTHVKRLAKWFGLTYHDTADKISRDLEKIFPQEEWGRTSLRLIFLGRDLLTARSPEYEGTKWEDLILKKYRS